MDKIEPIAPTLTLYEVLAEIAEPPHTPPGPDTIETKQIETVDNDFATILLGGIGI